MRNVFAAIVLVMVLGVMAWADGPADNAVDKVRPIPPIPKAMTQGDKADVEANVKAMGKEIEMLRRDLAGKPELIAVLPDVEIYYNALRYPLIYNEPCDM